MFISMRLQVRVAGRQSVCASSQPLPRTWIHCQQQRQRQLGSRLHCRRRHGKV